MCLPVADAKAAEQFWEKIGFVPTGENPEPLLHSGLISDSLNIALVAESLLKRPALLFTDADMSARIRALADKGVELGRPPGGLDPALTCAARRAGRHAAPADDSRMNRLIPALLALVAPAALAWPSCDQVGPDGAGRARARRTVLSRGRARNRHRGFGRSRDDDPAWTAASAGSASCMPIHPAIFEQAAAIGVRGWRFEPARLDGVPVECRMLTRLRFTLVDTVDAAGRPLASKDRPDPVYPARMLADRVEGYAELEFQVAEPAAC